jgi:hypothetical protein
VKALPGLSGAIAAQHHTGTRSKIHEYIGRDSESKKATGLGESQCNSPSRLSACLKCLRGRQSVNTAHQHSGRSPRYTMVLLAPPSPPRSLQRFFQPPNPSLSNRLTPPGSRTHHESGRISSIHGLGQETGNMIVRSPDTYHDSFDWSEVQRT